MRAHPSFPWELYSFRWDEAAALMDPDVYNALLLEYCEREISLTDGTVVVVDGRCPDARLHGHRGVIVEFRDPCIVENAYVATPDVRFKELILDDSQRMYSIATSMVFTIEPTGEVLSDEEISGILDSWSERDRFKRRPIAALRTSMSASAPKPADV